MGAYRHRARPALYNHAAQLVHTSARSCLTGEWNAQVVKQFYLFACI